MQNIESGDDTNDGGESADGGDKTKQGWRVETTSEEADNEERMEEEENEEYGEEEEDGKESTAKKVKQEAVLQMQDSKREKCRETSSQNIQSKVKRLSAKRKAEKDKVEQIKELSDQSRTGAADALGGMYVATGRLG